MSTDDHTLLHIYAGLPKTVRGRPITIHADPKGKTFLYCNGNSVFIRDIENPSECDVYTQHAKDTTCAAYAPSGFYICSADISGKVRIWDTVNKTHILKSEYQPLSGAIKDISWSEDSTRIGVCGEGREQVASVFMLETGTSCGVLSGPAKACNNISIKQNRPYRLAVASEDFSSTFYEGPPFKFKTQFYEHTNFANCCRFSPDGSKYATAGADGKCFIHDGKTGELLGELCEAAGKIHKAGIYGISWSPDGKQLMTCSADKTVKIWNMDEKYYISNKELVGDETEMGLHCVFQMGDKLEDMQLGCTWIGNSLISVSLSGHINYLDMENSTSPKKIIKGHNKAITTSCLSEDRSFLFTASFEGLICYWDLSTGTAEPVKGAGHTNQVQKMDCVGDTIATCSMDDTVRFISVADKSYKDTVIKLTSQPQGIAVGGVGMVVVVCLDRVVVIQDMKVTHTYETKSYQPTCVAINTSLGIVLVGTAEENKAVIYDIEGDQLKESGSLPCNGKVTGLHFSPDSQYLAMCTSKKQVKVMMTSDLKNEKKRIERGNWASHAGTVTAISWTPDSRHLASCGVDGAVYTFDVEGGSREATIRGAHAQSVDVTSVQWPDDNTLITTGRQDCSVRVWQMKH